MSQKLVDRLQEKLFIIPTCPAIFPVRHVMGNEMSGEDGGRPPSPPPPHIDLPLREFTLEELREYDGTNPIPELEGTKAIYIALNETVFDVTAGKSFYGPGKGYHCFAGRDASRGLATMEFQARPHICGSWQTKDTWDDISDLCPADREVLDSWEDRFREKYIVRGRLVPAKQQPGARSPSTARTAARPKSAGGRNLIEQTLAAKGGPPS
eukprot:m.88961 g.88961  ORF g.88961 m.88961 type:complete len:210 (-) comp8388_c0_seq5:154-783(-)